MGLPFSSVNPGHTEPQETYTMPTPRVIFVGGFLGAGKTTLLGKAVEHLTRQGRPVRD